MRIIETSDNDVRKLHLELEVSDMPAASEDRTGARIRQRVGDGFVTATAHLRFTPDYSYCNTPARALELLKTHLKWIGVYPDELDEVVEIAKRPSALVNTELRQLDGMRADAHLVAHAIREYRQHRESAP